MPLLDGLRGLALLMVLAHHFVAFRPLHPVERWFVRVAELGTPAIDIFFVLSGFLITGILLDMRGEPGYFRRFYLRRGLRIFPLYYLLLFVVCVGLPPLYRAGRASATSLDSLTDTVRHWPWFVSYLSNVLFALKKSFMDRTLAVTWSLGVEEQFYLAWALLVAFVPVRRLLWLWGALIPLTIAWRVGLLQNGSGWVPVWVTTPSHLASIAGGSLVAAWLRLPGYRPGAAARPARLATAAGLVGCAALFLAGRFNHFSPLFLTVGYVPLVLTMVGGLTALLHADPRGAAGRFFNSRVLRFYARHSYAIYLVHLPLADLVKGWGLHEARLRTLPGSILLWQALFYLIAIGLASGVGWLSWRFVEAPLLGLKDRWAPGPARREAAAA